MRKTGSLCLLIAGLVAAPLALADENPATTVSGVMFLDMTDISAKMGSTDVDPTGYGLDVKRFYIGVNHVFDDTWSANFVTDFNYSSTTGETQLFAKKAYLQQHLSDQAILRYGAAEMPWIPYEEAFYGYRFVEKTELDKLGFGNTVDWGVHFLGTSGSVNYAVSVVNGGGFKNPTRTKSMDEEARIGFSPVDGLTLALGYYTGKLGQDTELTPAVNTASREDLLVAWKANGLTLGLSYFNTDDFNKAIIIAPGSDKADGYSLFGSFDVPGTAYSVFARYDDAKPSKDLAPNRSDKYWNMGFAWKTSPTITWAVAYKNEKLEDTTLDAKTQELGVWAQIKF